MKNLLVLLATTFLGLSAFSHDHPINHVKHNMVLFGDKQLFASHIVYKEPHNYQVILKLTMPQGINDKAYLDLIRSRFPDDTFIFLLDELEIKDIARLDFISGTILRENSAGIRDVIFNHVVFKKSEFIVIYFNELPLSLAKTPAVHP